MRCNGKSITSNNQNFPDTLQKSTILKFEWDCEVADSFYVEFIPIPVPNPYTGFSFFSSTRVYENVTFNPGLYSVRITAYTGNLTQRFTNPHFIGNYGKGISNYYIMSINYGELHHDGSETNFAFPHSSGNWTYKPSSIELTSYSRYLLKSGDLPNYVGTYGSGYVSGSRRFTYRYEP